MSGPSMDDCSRSDLEGFESFFRREHARLLAVAVAMVGDREVARELVQESLLRAFNSWLRRVAAGLRERIAASADTDRAWAEFGAARPITVVGPRTRVDDGRRWRITIVVGMVAVLVAALVIVREVPGTHPMKRPVVTTPVVPLPTTPPTTAVASSADAGFAAVVLEGDDEIVAVDPGGTRQIIGRVPSEVLDGLRAPVGYGDLNRQSNCSSSRRLDGLPRRAS